MYAVARRAVLTQGTRANLLSFELSTPALTPKPRPRPRWRPRHDGAHNTTRQLTTSAAALATQAAQLRPDTFVTVEPEIVSPRRNFSNKKFADAPISKQSKAAISYDFMSDVQAATLHHALEGRDLLVQAKTGTGKTIAFLLPTIERLLHHPKPPTGISILVLSPTRELALQIEQEAKVLLGHHQGFTVGHAIGGTNVKPNLEKLLKRPPTILVATPGRLHDFLTTDEGAGIRAKFQNLQALVLDEADRLLDQGFKKELDGIVGKLPDRKQVNRQVLLFSATVGQDIIEIAKKVLNRDHMFISTLEEGETNTHKNVPQSMLLTSFANTLPLALRILRTDRSEHILPGINPSDLDFSSPTLSGTPSEPVVNTLPVLSTSKVIVFFPTARHVTLAYSVFASIPGLPKVWELHSRRSQSAREKASREFKMATEGILLCSDVAARGVDYPEVTLVLQLNLPASSDQYIHRLGRTARGDSTVEGRGVIVLDPTEEKFLQGKDVKILGITEDARFANLTKLPKGEASDPLAPERLLVNAVLSCQPSVSFPRPSGSTEVALGPGVSAETKAQAYVAWLGYYKSHPRILGWDSRTLVSRATAYVRDALMWGNGTPEVEAKTVGKMGLKGVPGLNIVKKRVKVE